MFAVTVKAVKIAGEAKVDDDFAKALGLQSLDQLRGLIRDQQQQELNGLTRTHMKRQLLDQLAANATISRCRCRWSRPNIENIMRAACA